MYQRSTSRKLNRLKGINYSESGYYYVTLCTKERINWFGEAVDKKIVLNEYGEIVYQCWFDLPNHYNNCLLDEFVIMPNHIHGIIIIKNTWVKNESLINNVGNGFKPFPTKYSLSEIVRGLKTFSSRRINEMHNKIWFCWQKSFYDHIIRNEDELIKIREYICSNPLNLENGDEERY